MEGACAWAAKIRVGIALLLGHPVEVAAIDPAGVDARAREAVRHRSESKVQIVKKKSPPSYRVEVVFVGTPESATIAEQKVINSCDVS